MLTDILSHVDAPLPRPVLTRFVITCFERLWYEYQKNIVARYDWGDRVRHGLTAVVATQIQGFSDTELARFMVTLMLIGELHPAESRHPDSPLLEEIAAHYHVDSAAIRKQVTSTLEAKKAKSRAAGSQSRAPAQATSA